MQGYSASISKQWVSQISRVLGASSLVNGGCPGLLVPDYSRDIPQTVGVPGFGGTSQKVGVPDIVAADT